MSELQNGMSDPTPDPLRALACRDGTMTFGVMVPHFGRHASRQRIIAGSAMVERLGFDAVWVRDHLLWTPHENEDPDITFVEPLMALAAIAAVTERIYLGTAVLVPLRWPLKLAQDLAALSYLSDGRVVAGLGLGRKQVELEVTGFSGMDRRAVVDESVTILRRVWSEDCVTHSGQLFSFEDAQIKPKPARPLPLWYGGTTRAAIRRAVGAFDGWMPGGLPLDTLNDRLAYLREQSEAAGRRLPVIGYIPRLSIARSRAEARAAIDLSTMAMGSEGTKHWVRPKSGGFERIEDLHGAILVGEPEDVVEQVLELGQQGIDHVVFDLRHQFDRYEESLELIGERVLPALRAELARA